MDPRPPSGFVTGLRKRADCDSLAIVFDPEASRKEARQVWSILYVNGRGEPTFVCDWTGGLDGNLGALAEKVRRLDTSRTRDGFKSYARGLLAGLKAKDDAVARRRLDDWRQRAGYLRKAVQAQAYGKPDLRSFWQVPA